ncbi:MAG: metal ABC transporter substrate-binding protein [Candidatus Villigracilaceae bacterium]
MKTKLLLSLPLIVMLALSACSGVPVGREGRLNVVASTTIVGDVVAQVGGDLIELTVLFPPGANPHTFQPRPQDIAAISKAQVIILNGLGLEEALEPALKANATGTIVHASEGIEPLPFHGKKHAHEGEGEHHHEGGDPHTWIDPNNVIVWAKNIAAALAAADPQHAAAYQANATAYIASLRDLDAWIRQQVAQVPVARRKLVTDHLLYGYFAQEYGFEQVGALIGSFSTNASPSAQELAALEDLIRAQNVPAVFVGKNVNPALAEQVAQDTGIRVVSLYTGSLSQPGGEADSYLKYMRYNVSAIVEALK